MTEHPNATDYRNRGERDAAYWREQADKLAEGLRAMIASRDYCCPDREYFSSGGPYGDYWSPSTSQIESKAVAVGRAALDEYEAAQINAEALR